MPEDKRLERLYDYTKFHIGIYLGFSSALVTLIASKKLIVLEDFIGSPLLFFFGLLFMILAGVAGAIVATSTIESETYDSFIVTKQGAYGFNPLVGKTWVTLEHLFFWLSLLSLLLCVLLGKGVKEWLFCAT